MDKPQQKDGSDYFAETREKPVPALLVKALESINKKGKAIDIGAGALRSSRYLLDQGFEVTAIDSSPLFAAEAQRIQHKKFRYKTVTVEAFDFPQQNYDLVAAMFSLPFCHPKIYDVTFRHIKHSLKYGGIFCGQFFGTRDEWAQMYPLTMTFHTEKQIRTLLGGFEILSLAEEEKEDGQTVTGIPKHWHVFHVIARKLSLVQRLKRIVHWR